MQKTYSLQKIANLIGDIKVHGDPNYVITSLNTLVDAQSNEISFLDNEKYKIYLTHTKAGAVILKPEYLSSCPTNALLTNNPYLVYAKVAKLFWSKPQAVKGIHSTAIIDSTAQLANNLSIGPFVVIGRNVVIKENVVIGAHVVIGDDVTIESDTEINPNVTIYYGTKIGARCIIDSGVVIGSDGFGFAPHEENYEKIPQLGRVFIEDDVNIGANTTIDRGALSDTIIGRGVKLDNQIQIGHNVKIGMNTVIAGCTGIAGSTEIGKNCMIGGAAGIAGHLRITDHVWLTGMAMVTHSIDKPGVYASGTGLLPRADWQRAVVRFRQLKNPKKTSETKSS